MKKSFLFIALAGTIAFSSYSNDDDESDCRTCEILTISTEYCINDNGSVTATTLGEAFTITEEQLEGQTPEEYIDAVCAASGLFGETE